MSKTTKVNNANTYLTNRFWHVKVDVVHVDRIEKKTDASAW